MMAFMLATDFDFIAYMSKMALFFFFFFGSYFSRQWRFWNMIYFHAIIETKSLVNSARQIRARNSCLWNYALIEQSEICMRSLKLENLHCKLTEISPKSDLEVHEFCFDLFLHEES